MGTILNLRTHAECRDMLRFRCGQERAQEEDYIIGLHALSHPWRRSPPIFVTWLE